MGIDQQTEITATEETPPATPAPVIPAEEPTGEEPPDTIIVTAKKPNSSGPSAGAVIGFGVGAALDPAGTLRGLIGDGLKKLIPGDINQDTFNQALKLLNGDKLLGDQIKTAAVNYVLERGVDAAANAAGMGAGAAVGGVIDAAQFQMAHQEVIKAMAEKGVPGYGYEKRDINGDGKIDTVWVDATACLKDPEAEPVYYTNDGIADLKSYGPPSKNFLKSVPDHPEVVARAIALGNAKSNEVLDFAHTAEAAGEDPSSMFAEVMDNKYAPPSPAEAVASQPAVASNNPAPS